MRELIRITIKPFADLNQIVTFIIDETLVNACNSIDWYSLWMWIILGALASLNVLNEYYSQR